MNKFSAEDSFSKGSLPLRANRKIWAVNVVTSRKGRKCTDQHRAFAGHGKLCRLIGDRVKTG
ncbi:hypothetical protein SAMN05216299_11583 [Nitrosospira sp. Nsp14]|nr:hypothetical protein SAMN05216299_11583 [Nitrosospira sp. Nsp14]